MTIKIKNTTVEVKKYQNIFVRVIFFLDNFWKIDGFNSPIIKQQKDVNISNKNIAGI